VTNETAFSGISRKEDNLVRYAEIFKNLSLGISVTFDFPPGISVEWFACLKLNNFRIPGNFPWKLPYHLSPFRNFQSFEEKCRGTLDLGRNPGIIPTQSRDGIERLKGSSEAEGRRRRQNLDRTGPDRTRSRIGSRIGSWIGSQIGSRIGSQIGSRIGSQKKKRFKEKKYQIVYKIIINKK